MTQYLTLGVDREAFAIPVAQVQEILDLRPIARLPHAPPEIVGLIEVRGRSVAVVDLRIKMGLAAAEATDTTRIVILNAGVAGAGTFGLLADRVHDVADLDADALEAAPELGTRWDSDYIQGIGRWRDGFVIVLDLDMLLRGQAMNAPGPAAVRAA